MTKLHAPVKDEDELVDAGSFFNFLETDVGEVDVSVGRLRLRDEVTMLADFHPLP